MLTPFTAHVDAARFEVVRRLGAGGIGIVYEAFDHERKCRVALKTARVATPETLNLLRREFERMSGLSHPHLVRLFDYGASEDQCFFTMELVEGLSFVEYARPAGHVDEPRLRNSLKQLADGLIALHQADHKHRDIKPSNVMVTDAGRVVVLDFGLVTDMNAAEVSAELEPRVLGTAAYMAPEQASSDWVGPSADWYAVGAMLYEALTGNLPFSGAGPDVLAYKLRFEPPPPHAICAEVPEDLESLCVDLLRIDPDLRPSAQEIIARLQGPQASSTSNPVPGNATTANGFVGRREQRHVLEAAFQELQTSNSPVTVLIEGESGIGKTALAAQFAQDLHRRQINPLFLKGGYYQEEASPYRAIHGIFDDISRFMARLPDETVERLLPPSAPLLCDVFPMMRRVRTIVDGPATTTRHEVDPQEQRSRLFAAVRELFLRLSGEHPTVVVLDDLQWADADSLALISELVRPPDAPRFLLVAITRTMDAEAVVGSPQVAFCATVHHRIRLGRLSADDSCTLAQKLAHGLDGLDGLSAESVENIAAEAEGHPLFIQELVRYTESHGDPSTSPLRFDDVLRARIEQVSQGARTVLELVAVAGRPVSERAVCHAASMKQAQFRYHLGELRKALLIDTTDTSGNQRMRVYHSRLRETLVEGLTPEALRRAHLELALALETLPNENPEHLATHWREANDVDRAVKYLDKAASKAETQLAFDHAAELYRQALALAHGEDGSRHRFRLKVARALAKAGRGADAAEMYLLAAQTAPDADALEFRRNAAFQLLTSGHIEKGLEQMQTTLAAVGIPYPSSPLRALLSALLRRLLVRLRGLDFRDETMVQAHADELKRIDICAAAALGLSLVDNIRGADFNSRTLLMAMRVGEPLRLLRAMCYELAFVASTGSAGWARANALMPSVDALAGRVASAEAQGWTLMARGTLQYFSGNFQQAAPYLADGERVFRDECAGMIWELDTVRFFRIVNLYFLGHLAELARLVPQHVAEACDRGNLYCATNLQLGAPHLAWLIRDDLPTARGIAAAAARAWTAQGFHLQHWYALEAETRLDLYAGRPRRALDRILTQWPALNRSMVLRVQVVRVSALQLRASACIATAEIEPAERARLLRQAARDVKQLFAQKVRWSEGIGLLLHGSIGACRGDTDEAILKLGKAIEVFGALHMSGYEATCQHQLGRLLGGDEGRRLLEQAKNWMARESIRDPERWTATLAPGFHPRN